MIHARRGVTGCEKIKANARAVSEPTVPRSGGPSQHLTVEAINRLYTADRGEVNRALLDGLRRLQLREDHLTTRLWTAVRPLQGSLHVHLLDGLTFHFVEALKQNPEARDAFFFHELVSLGKAVGKTEQEVADLWPRIQAEFERLEGYRRWDRDVLAKLTDTAERVDRTTTAIQADLKLILESPQLTTVALRQVFREELERGLQTYLQELARDIPLTPPAVDDLPRATVLAPPASSSKPASRLPVEAMPFIGRARDLVEVQQLLVSRAVRLLTLTGPGGVGKTRLALEAVSAMTGVFADGVIFVHTHHITELRLVIPTVAALGLEENQRTSQGVQQFLGAKQLLMVLDGFEHILGAALEIGDLLAACPGLVVLVTSRAALNLAREHQFQVDPLPVPDFGRLPYPSVAALKQNDAVALFVQRAQQVAPGFKLTDANAVEVAEITARLGGLPLALELAAAQTDLLPPRALLARLESRSPFLAPDRQRTMRASVPWSYDLLASAEQALFRRLAIFAGSCTLEAAEAVGCGTDAAENQCLDKIIALIEQSLLLQERRDDREVGDFRVYMPEPFREFGLERLASTDELREASLSHASYFLALAEQVAAHLRPEAADGGLDDREQWLGRLDAERANVLKAMVWAQAAGETEIRERLGTALGAFLAAVDIGRLRGWIRFPS